VTDVGTMVGTVAPRQDGDGFVAAVANGFGFVVDGKLDPVDEVLPEPRLRMNGAKVDSRGRFWAGSNDVDFEPAAAGCTAGTARHRASSSRPASSGPIWCTPRRSTPKPAISAASTS